MLCYIIIYHYLILFAHTLIIILLKWFPTVWGFIILKMQLIYLLALPLAFCHDNVTLTELSYSDCILALQYYNTDQFNLINCYKSGENGFYSTSNWGECTYRCCSPVKSYEQVRSSVDSCDDDRRSYMAWLTGIIIGSIFGGLIGIPLLIILGCFICDRWKNRVVVNSFPSIESQTSLNPLNFFERIRWNPSKRKEGYDCLVCNLGESQIELFDCKHMVHWECWKESYIKEK